jgi:O-antigen/teichoic acid export membrane protein
MSMTIEPDQAAPRKLIGRASIVAAGTAYQQGISFLSGLIVARVIGAADYGIFNLARHLLDLTAIVTRLGLELGLQKHFGESNSAHDRESHILVLRRVRLLAAMFALLPVAAVALGVGRLLEAHVYPYPHFAEILLCLALALPFLTDIAVLGGAYRGVLKFSSPVIAESVLLPTIRLAAILILFTAGWKLWAVVVGTTIGSLLSAAFLAMRARSDFPVAGTGPARSWQDAFRVMRYSSVLALGVLVGTLTSSMDILMLGHFATARELGQYSLAKMLLMLMAVFGPAFTQGLGALVAQRHAHGDLAGMVRIMSLSARMVTLVTLPIFAIFLFWGAQLTLVFGPSFAVSQSVVSWLAISQFGFLIFGHSGWALSMTGRHVLELKILSAGLAAAAILSWLAVPAYGQLGAAVATCTSMTVINLARILFVRRFIGAFPFSPDIITITAAGIALAWCSHALAAQLGLPSHWNTVCGIGTFVLAYGAVCWTHVLSQSEKSGIHWAAGSTARILLWRGN